MSFASFGLDPKFLKALEDLGFETPTPIQDMAIPPLMEGRDVLAAAATGSGKTAAFVLPILHHLLGKPRGKTRALVLAPTRELAAQITEHLAALAVHTHLTGQAVYGGVGMEPQVKAFKRGVDVIVATPGRLLDHFQYPYAKLDALEYLVLDEADRMLDMGFLPDVRRILKALPKERKTLLFSATLPSPIVELAREMLKDPARLNVERKATPAAGITHAAYPVSHELKSHLLLELLKLPEARSVLAFTRTKHRANRLADFLEKRGVSCERIHGNRSQLQRTEALRGFKAGKFRVMVATDIAARGIDVEALGLVVNFDVPNISEDYIHRVGRTARAELKGHAFTLVSPEEEHDLRAIESAIGNRIPRQKVQGFDYAHKPQEKLEIPIAERIAAIRARKSDERARAKAKLEAKTSRAAAQPEVKPTGGRQRTGGESKGRHAAAGRSQGDGGWGSNPTRNSRPERSGSAEHRRMDRGISPRPEPRTEHPAAAPRDSKNPAARGGEHRREGGSERPSRTRESVVDRPSTQRATGGDRPPQRRDDRGRDRQSASPATRGTSFIRSSQRPDWDRNPQPSDGATSDR